MCKSFDLLNFGANSVDGQRNTVTQISKNKLKCGLGRQEQTSPGCVSSSQMSLSSEYVCLCRDAVGDRCSF